MVGVVAVEGHGAAGEDPLGREVAPRRRVVAAPGEGAELVGGGRQPGVARAAHLHTPGRNWSNSKLKCLVTIAY